MEKQKEFTEAQISILLWLKALDDFKEGSCKDKTFTEKYNEFEEVDAIGFTSKEYMDTVDFWVGCGILKDEEVGYSISEKGKELFKKLDEMQGMEDEVIRKKLNNIKNITEMMYATKEFIKGHYPEIIKILLDVVHVALKHL